MWSVQTGELLKKWLNHSHIVTSVAFAPDGQTIVSGSLDGTFKVTDVQTGEERNVVDGFTDLAAWAVVPTVPHGRALFVTARDEIQVWDIPSGQKLRTLDKNNSDIAHLALFADGKTLGAAGTWDQGLKIWDIDSGKLISERGNIGSQLRDIALSPDGRQAAVRGEWRWAVVLDLASGEHAYWIDPQNPVNQLAYSPDGKMLIVTSAFTVRLWDTEARAFLRELTLPGLCYGKPAFTPDGKWVAFGVWGDETNAIWLWDVDTGQVVRTLTGHSGRVADLTFSPDGVLLVAGVRDDKTYLWQVDSGDLLRVLDTAPAGLVRFAAEGSVLALTLGDGTVRLWGIPPGD